MNFRKQKANETHRFHHKQKSPGQVVEVLQASVLLQGIGKIDDPIDDWEHEVVGLSANRAAQPKLDAGWLAGSLGLVASLVTSELAPSSKLFW